MRFFRKRYRIDLGADGWLTIKSRCWYWPFWEVMGAALTMRESMKVIDRDRKVYVRAAKTTAIYEE